MPASASLSANRAVFLSYAHEDAVAALRIAEALRSAGIEVWFDQSELRGGDAWDHKIRTQIQECALFLPVISAATQTRLEGYFRIEWKLAAQRTYAMAEARPFLLPVVIDATRDAEAHVPQEFRAVQWTRLPNGETAAAFVQRVQALLASGLVAGVPGPLAGRGDIAEPKPGDRIGHYRLLEKIGEGGCGIVWRAEQEKPVHRRVALKVIKLGMDTKEVIGRFEAERQALALMDHPNIARVFDAGTTDTGRPFFVMELVRGVPITRFCDEHNLSTATRLELCIQVCHAIQHAHQKGIIHRDIKPSNVLVTLQDDEPATKVIDFGIAKATNGRLTDQTVFTAVEQFIGTPAYMSPEQAEMSGLDVDTRSDIYSLGVLLYELLTGGTPFDRTELLKAGWDEMRRTIRETEPPRPSTRLSKMHAESAIELAQHRGVDVPRLIALVRGDLDWIVMKCLEKDRTRRYDSATGLATDIQHHLRHEPIVARPPSNAYRIGKFIRRHRVGVAASGALALSLLGGLIASSTLFVRERAAHGRATAAEQSEGRLRKQAEAARIAEAKRASRTSQALAEQLFQDGKTAEGLAHLVRAVRSDPENFVVGPRLMSALAYRGFALTIGEPITDVDMAGYIRDGKHVWTYRADPAAKASDPERTSRRTERFWSYRTDGMFCVRDLFDGRQLHSFKVEGGGSGADSQDGRRLAVARADGSVIVLDTATGRTELGPLHHGSRLRDIAFSPDGRWLATSGSDRTVKIWDVVTGKPMVMLPHARPVETVNFSPDSQQIVTATGSSGRWQVWSVPDGKAVTSPTARFHPNTGLFSPDGSLLAMTDNVGVQVFEAASGYRVGQELNQDSPSYYAAFSPDGSILANGSDDGTARLWEMPSGKLMHSVQHGARVVHVRFSPDGRFLLTHCADGTVRIWDVRTGRLAQERVGTGEVNRIDLTPDGREFLTCSRDRTARRWHLAPGAVQPLRLPADPDRRHILIESNTTDTAWVLYRQRLQLLHLLSGQAMGTPRPLPVTVAAGTLARRAEFACVYLGATGWEIWDLRGSEVVRHRTGVSFAARRRFCPESSHFASIDQARNLRVWDTTNGAAVLGPIVNANLKYDFSSDGRRLVTTTAFTNRGFLWNLASGENAGESFRTDRNIQTVRFSPDDHLFATGATDSLCLWDATTARLVRSLQVHPTGVGMRDIAFSRDSRRLLTCDPLEVRLWDVATGAPLTPPLRGPTDIYEAVFTGNDRLVAAVGRSAGEVRVWDSQTGQLHSEPLRANRRADFEALQFLADGRFAVIGGDVPAGEWLIWPVPPPAGGRPVPVWLLRLATAMAGGEIDDYANFRERPFDAKVLDDVRRELTALPAAAPLAEWGRWFLADRATRPIGPGFKITAAEAEQLTGDRSGRDLLALERRAGSLERTGQFAEEAEVVAQALRLARERWGDESKEAAGRSAWLAWVLIKAKQPAEAELAARTAIAIREKLPNPDTPDLALARQRLGWALLDQGRHAEAESVLFTAYEAYQRFEASAILSSDQRSLMRWTAELLARVFEATQQPNKTAEWRQKAAAPPAPKPGYTP